MLSKLWMRRHPSVVALDRAARERVRRAGQIYLEHPVGLSRPAQSFPPGEYLLDEMAERSVSLAELALATGIARDRWIEIINDATVLHAEEAIALELIGWGSSQMWVRLSNRWAEVRA